MKKKILVSACLLGHDVRYDNGIVKLQDERFERWKQEGRLVAICPEVTGGLPTPRPDAQIQGDRIVTGAGADVTAEFTIGAEATLALADKFNIALAILKQDSPSCGTLYIYDGTFTDTKVEGEGATTALLRKHGYKVFGEDQLDEAEHELVRAEAQG